MRTLPLELQNQKIVKLYQNFVIYRRRPFEQSLFLSLVPLLLLR